VEDLAVLAPGSGWVLISHAHDDRADEQYVLEFCEFLRDALIDAEVAMRPQYWPDWMKPPRSCTVASGRRR